jgi:hypothetical protein
MARTKRYSRVATPWQFHPKRRCCDGWCLVMSEREPGGAHTIYTCRTPRAGLTVGCSSESWLREQFANTPTSCATRRALHTTDAVLDSRVHGTCRGSRARRGPGFARAIC